MYNRYIPQSDGSFRKRAVPESVQNRPERKQQEEQSSQPPALPMHQPKPASGSALTFLKQLLPKEFDTGDLLILLLLLLMAGDCEEEKNNALLTMALYFFM